MTDARIVPDPNKPHDPTEVRVSPSMVPVWALVGYWKAVGFKLAKVRADYGITSDELNAALAWYARHPTDIDVRLKQND